MRGRERPLRRGLSFWAAPWMSGRTFPIRTACYRRDEVMFVGSRHHHHVAFVPAYRAEASQRHGALHRHRLGPVVPAADPMVLSRAERDGLSEWVHHAL